MNESVAVHEDSFFFFFDDTGIKSRISYMLGNAAPLDYHPSCLAVSFMCMTECVSMSMCVCVN